MTPAEVFAAVGTAGSSGVASSAVVVGAGALRLKPKFDACGVRSVVWVEARPWAVTYARDKYPAIARFVLQACVGNTNDKTVKFYELKPGYAAYSSCCPPRAQYARLRGYHLMRTVTLDSLLAQHRHCLPSAFASNQNFDLAWIDTCGSEMQVLEGMRAVPLLVYVRSYSGTHTGATTPDQLDAFFNAIGFSLVLTQNFPDGNSERVYKF